MTSLISHNRLCISRLSVCAKLILMITVLSLATTSKLNASPEDDAKAVAALDTKYQAAVKANDATTMNQILADDFVLVTGRGSVFSKADLLDSARKKEATYERQDEEPGTQKVRVWGYTAVVTALLQAGATYLARLPCHCLKRNPSRINAHGRFLVIPSGVEESLDNLSPRSNSALLFSHASDNKQTMVSLYPERLLGKNRNRRNKLSSNRS